jgi:DNA repair exonuclease SbcCD nuclease subunit
MMIFFADTHLGNKTYHSLTDDNITTSEADSRIALDCIYDRCKDDEVDLIVCAGDFFNSSKSSAETIRWTINWFKRMNSLAKPFYIIPGNHDIGAFFHSMEYTKELELNNVFLIENDISKIIWGDWNIYFAPFIIPKSLKNKYADTVKLLNQISTIVDPKQKNMIITHIQESDSKLGSEAFMLSKKVEIIDLNNSEHYANTLFLAGHMHMQQTYEKLNGIKVVYPGSLTYLDKIDCDQKKGYATISYDGVVSFEPIQGIRLFKHYVLPKEKSPVDFFNSIRMSKKEVVFLTIQDDTVVNEAELRETLRNRNCTLGKVLYGSPEELQEITLNLASKDPIYLLEEYLSKREQLEPTEMAGWQNTILPMGKSFYYENKLD